jgi:predicted nucleic acid-binding protein
MEEAAVYDTSTLIDFLKSGKRDLKGFTTILNIIEFPKALEFKGLGIIYPNVEDYDEALKLSALLLKRGKPLPAIDILIAAICLRRGLTLMTGDEHFRHIKSVKKEFKVEITK